MATAAEGSDEAVVDRPRQRAPVEHQLGVEVEHVRDLLGLLLLVDVPALAEHVEEQDRSSPRVLRVLAGETRMHLRHRRLH